MTKKTDTKNIETADTKNIETADTKTVDTPLRRLPISQRVYGWIVEALDHRVKMQVQSKAHQIFLGFLAGKNDFRLKDIEDSCNVDFEAHEEHVEAALKALEKNG